MTNGRGNGIWGRIKNRVCSKLHTLPGRTPPEPAAGRWDPEKDNLKVELRAGMTGGRIVEVKNRFYKSYRASRSYRRIGIRGARDVFGGQNRLLAVSSKGKEKRTGTVYGQIVKGLK